jgi:hypothetical protein
MELEDVLNLLGPEDDAGLGNPVTERFGHLVEAVARFLVAIPVDDDGRQRGPASTELVFKDSAEQVVHERRVRAQRHDGHLAGDLAVPGHALLVSSLNDGLTDFGLGRIPLLVAQAKVAV